MKVIKIDCCLRCPFSRLSICRDKTEMICSYCDKTIIKDFGAYDGIIPEWCELSDEWNEYDEYYERKA